MKDTAFPQEAELPRNLCFNNISQFIGKHCLVCCKAVQSWFWFSLQLLRRVEFNIGIFGRAVLVKWLTKILFPASISSFQYLASSKCGQYVDIGILASDLQKTYRWASICLLISCVQNVECVSLFYCIHYESYNFPYVPFISSCWGWLKQ